MSRSGLAGVTLGVLADQVGMSKSGLFAHFRSKEDVQIELLTHMAELVMAHVIEPSMTAGEGLPRLRALVSYWFGWAQRAGLPGGCPVAAGLFEFDDIEGRVRNKILELEGEFRRQLTELVQHAVDLVLICRNSRNMLNYRHVQESRALWCSWLRIVACLKAGFEARQLSSGWR
jgi:AcrR family transcriptional regulator